MRTKMLGFLGKKQKKEHAPVICERADHCISRRNIDQSTLDILYALSRAHHTSYLAGECVCDLLQGRRPRTYAVATDAVPEDLRAAVMADGRCKKRHYQCQFVGNRFKSVQVRAGGRMIEVSTFRQSSLSVGDIIEHAAALFSATHSQAANDRAFGTPETDAARRDFTVNGLFYDIKTFKVIDWVGGLKDLEKRVIRSIGDPLIRFREEPVRMMRALSCASRFDFTIERATEKAIRSLHETIRTAPIADVCKIFFDLFREGASERAFRLMWEYGLLGDLLPDLSDFIATHGGRKSVVWKYLSIFDRFARAMEDRRIDVSDGLRLACLYAAYAKENPERIREVLGVASRALRMSKAVYFSAVQLLDSVKRFSQPPQKGSVRFVHNAEFADALDFNRILARAENRDEKILDQWVEFAHQFGQSPHVAVEEVQPRNEERAPVVCAPADHGITRRKIDPCALDVLDGLARANYTAYLVGGGVRDLLLGRQPKDFDVGTNARPEEVRSALRRDAQCRRRCHCLIIGKRFKLVHVRFGEKIIETATFRANSQTAEEIREHAEEMMESANVKPLEDNTYGTPKTDAYRRDFTVNGLFYDIRTGEVLDWVGGLKDLKEKIIRKFEEKVEEDKAEAEYRKKRNRKGIRKH